jgi:hypothetical protein
MSDARRIHGVPLPRTRHVEDGERWPIDRWMAETYPEVSWVKAAMIRRTFTDGGWGDPHPQVTHISLMFEPDPLGDGGVTRPTGLRQEDLDVIAVRVVEQGNGGNYGNTWTWQMEIPF